MKRTDELTRDEKSLLLYFETCMVNDGCRVDQRRMNEEDRAIAAQWSEHGFIHYGRIPIDIIRIRDRPRGNNIRPADGQQWHRSRT